MRISNITNIVEGKLEDLKKVPMLYDFVMENCYLAGGAVRDINMNRAPKDYDIYFYTKDAVTEFGNRFGKNGMEETPLGNFNYKDFQFITVQCGNPILVTGTFDWNVNQQYYEFKKKKIGYSGYGCEGNDLRFNTKSSYPLSAVLRMPYLIQKGFTITPKEFAFVMAYISTRGILNSPEEAQRQVSISPSSDMSMYNIAGSVDRARKAALEDSPLMKSLNEGISSRHLL